MNKENQNTISPVSSKNRTKFHLGYTDIEYIDDSDEEEYDQTAQLVSILFSIFLKKYFMINTNTVNYLSVYHVDTKSSPLGTIIVKSTSISSSSS